MQRIKTRCINVPFLSNLFLRGYSNLFIKNNQCYYHNYLLSIVHVLINRTFIF